MIRVILTIIVPLLLPTFVFAGYVLLQRWRTPPGEPPQERAVPWTLLILSGVGLAVLSAVAMAVYGDALRSGAYVPGETRPSPVGR